MLVSSAVRYPAALTLAHRVGHGAARHHAATEDDLLRQARIDGIVAGLGVALAHAIEELVIRDLAGLQQVQIVCTGWQMVMIAEIVEEEGNKIQVDRIDIVAITKQRLGHHAAEIEDGGVEFAVVHSGSRSRCSLCHHLPL